MYDIMLNRVINAHKIGSNCCTNSIRTILKSYDYDMSEEMVFGLGSGLGFIYQYYVNDGYFISGRNESIEFNLAYLLGGELISYYNDDFEVEWEAIKKLLTQKYPVIVDLTIPELPYFKKFQDQSDNVAFGLHNAVVVGYDAERVYLLEHRWNDVISISHEEFKRARSANNSSVAPWNAWKILVIPEAFQMRNIHNYFMESLETTINRMKNPFAFKMGLKGLQMFAEEVKKWNDLPQDELRKTLNCAYIFFETLGTGGGNFRRMYKRFLETMNYNVKRSDIEKAVSIYSILNREWKHFASEIKAESMEKEVIIKKTSYDRIKRIANLETEGIEALETILKNG